MIIWNLYLKSYQYILRHTVGDRLENGSFLGTMMFSLNMPLGADRSSTYSLKVDGGKDKQHSAASLAQSCRVRDNSFAVIRDDWRLVSCIHWLSFRPYPWRVASVKSGSPGRTFTKKENEYGCITEPQGTQHQVEIFPESRRHLTSLYLLNHF